MECYVTRRFSNFFLEKYALFPGKCKTLIHSVVRQINSDTDKNCTVIAN